VSSARSDGPAPGPLRDDKSVSHVRALVADLLDASSVTMARARRRVVAAPAELTVPELIAAIGRPIGWVAYQRAATALALIGDEGTMSVLAGEVARPGAFPMLAIRALERAPNEAASVALLSCLRACRGRRARRVARALATRHVAQAMVPICGLARRRDGGTDPQTLEILKLYGRPAKALTCVLTAAHMSVDERVDAVQAMESVPGLLGRFGVQRHLDREAANPRAPHRDTAAKVAHVYRNRTTLLRPSERSDDDRLLRPASGADRTPTDRLVRPSDAGDAPAPASHQPGLLSRIWEAVKDAIEGD